MNQLIAVTAVISEYITFKKLNIKKESFINWVLVNFLGVVKGTILVQDRRAPFRTVPPCLQNDKSFGTKSRQCNERN